MNLNIEEKILKIIEMIELKKGITLEDVYSSTIDNKGKLIPIIYIKLLDINNASITIPLNPNKKFMICSLTKPFLEKYIDNIDIIFGIVQ